MKLFCQLVSFLDFDGSGSTLYFISKVPEFSLYSLVDGSLIYVFFCGR